MRERFENDRYRISSVKLTYRNGRQRWHVVLVTKECGHERILDCTDNYRQHWNAMYAASEHFILGSGG